MSNRLEHEFPAVRWQAVPAHVVDRDLVRRAIERGRQLRSQAIRQGVRAALATAAGALVRAAAFVRCTVRSLAGRPPDRDCWAGSTRGA